MTRTPVTTEICPTSASIGVLRGRFMSVAHENVAIVYKDRIDMFVYSDDSHTCASPPSDECLQFVCSQRFTRDIVTAAAVHLPQSYLRNHLDAYEREIASQFSPTEVSSRQKRVGESHIDAIALVFRNHSVRVVVYTTANRNAEFSPGRWCDIARYMLDNTTALEDGKSPDASRTLSKIIVDEKHTCLLILENKRWLHVLSFLVKRIEKAKETNSSETQRDGSHGENSKISSSHDVDSWASILEMDETEEETEDIRPIDGSALALSDDILDPIKEGVFFDFQPLPFVIESSEPYFHIDLHSLSPPVCSVIDCIPLIGYSDPCFLFLHQPHLTWSGRMKLRTASSDTEAAQSESAGSDGNPNRGDSPAHTDHAIGLSVDEGKRMLSSTLSVMSLDMHRPSDAVNPPNGITRARVIWSLDGLPYNCTNLWLVHDPFPEKASRAEKTAPGDVSAKLKTRFGGGILVFSTNCVFFLTIAGRRTCYACFLNRYGEEELTSEKNQLVLCPGLLRGSGQTPTENLSGVALGSCMPMFLGPSKFLLLLSDGQAVSMNIKFAEGNQQMVSSFSFNPNIPAFAVEGLRGDADSRAIPSPSAVLPLRNSRDYSGDSFSVAFMLTSACGDAVLVHYAQNSSGVTDESLEIQCSIAPSLCPVSDFEVMSGVEEKTLAVKDWENAHPQFDILTNTSVNRPNMLDRKRLPDSRAINEEANFYDDCVRSTFLAVASGDGRGGASLNLLTTKVRPEICARFILHSDVSSQTDYDYFNVVELRDVRRTGEHEAYATKPNIAKLSVIFASTSERTNIVVLTPESVIDVTPMSAHGDSVSHAEENADVTALRKPFINFHTEPTVFVDAFNFEWGHRSELPEEIILHVTQSKVYLLWNDGSSWKIIADWELAPPQAEITSRILKAFLMGAPKNWRDDASRVYSIPLVLMTSESAILAITIEIKEQTSSHCPEVSLKTSHVVSDVPSEYLSSSLLPDGGKSLPQSSCVSQLNDKVLIGVHEKTAAIVLWKVTTTPNGYRLKLVKPSSCLPNALQGIHGKDVLEIAAYGSAMVVRTEHPPGIYVFQLTMKAISDSLDAENVTPPIDSYNMPVYMSPIHCSRFGAEEGLKKPVLQPISFQRKDSRTGWPRDSISGSNLKGIFVGGNSPMWVFSSSATGRVFTHAQRVGETPLIFNGLRALSESALHASKEAANFHFFLAQSGSTFLLLRLPAHFSYDAPCPIRKIMYNRPRIGLCDYEGKRKSANSSCTPLRVVNFQNSSGCFDSSQPEHGMPTSTSPIYVFTRSTGGLFVLQRNTEAWEAMNAAEKDAQSFQPPMTMTSFSIALFGVDNYGRAERMDIEQFPIHETVLEMTSVELTVSSSCVDTNSSAGADGSRMRESFVVVGSSFPTNEEQHCTGCLYLFTVGPSDGDKEQAALSAPKPNIYLVEKFRQQGPVTAVGTTFNGLLICTIGSKVMVFTLEKRRKHHPHYGQAGIAEGGHKTCFPYNLYSHELVLLYFFYSHSSIYISSIASFGRYIALSDLMNATNVYRLDCYAKKAGGKSESGPVGLSKSQVSTDAEEPEAELSPADLIGTCVAVQIAMDMQANDVTASSFVFSPQSSDSTAIAKEKNAGDVYLALSNASGDITLMGYPCRAVDEDNAKYKRDKWIESMETKWKSNYPGRVTRMKRITMPSLQKAPAGIENRKAKYVPSNASGLVFSTTEGQLELLAPLEVDQYVLSQVESKIGHRDDVDGVLSSERVQNREKKKGTEESAAAIVNCANFLGYPSEMDSVDHPADLVETLKEFSSALF